AGKSHPPVAAKPGEESDRADAQPAGAFPGVENGNYQEQQFQVTHERSSGASRRAGQDGSEPFGDQELVWRPPKTLAKNFLRAAATAATAMITSFQPFLISRKRPVNRPSLAAPTAAPPTTRAANPYLATLSPDRYSA